MPLHRKLGEACCPEEKAAFMEQQENQPQGGSQGEACLLFEPLILLLETLPQTLSEALPTSLYQTIEWFQL